MLLSLPAPFSLARLFGFARRARPRVTRWFAAGVRHGETREIAIPPGCVTLHCRGGEAWITHDGDPKDVVLRPDESYAVASNARLTVHALRGDCVMEVRVDS